MSTQQFRSFDLPGLLPPGHVLVVNQKNIAFDHYVLTELATQDCSLIAQEVFSSLDLYAVVALLEAYPHYCSYETLLSVLSDIPIDQARQIIHNAMEAHNLDSALNPLRNLLTRCRLRLHNFGLDIKSRRGFGYQLERIADGIRG